MENNITYAELDFKVTSPKRFTGIVGEKDNIPPIQIKQSDKILKKGDKISYTFKSPVVWLEPSEVSYDDDYLTYQGLSSDQKTIIFTLKEDMNVTSHKLKQLGFKIEEAGSFGIDIRAKVEHSKKYWNQ